MYYTCTLHNNMLSSHIQGSTCILYIHMLHYIYWCILKPHALILSYTRSHTHMHSYCHTHVLIHTCTHTHTYSYTHVLIHTCTHTHDRKEKGQSSWCTVFFHSHIIVDALVLVSWQPVVCLVWLRCCSPSGWWVWLMTRREWV